MIDISSLPTITIDLVQCKHPAEIKGLMKAIGITRYCYAFIHNTIVMKYGQSSDNDWIRGSYGERIYRQAGFIPGWSTQRAPGSAGDDMLDVIPHFRNPNKNNVSIKIWDMTNYPFAVASDPRHELTQVEDQLIDNYVQTYGYTPVGNIREEKHIRTKTRVHDSLFNSIFEVE